MHLRRGFHTRPNALFLCIFPLHHTWLFQICISSKKCSNWCKVIVWSGKVEVGRQEVPADIPDSPVTTSWPGIAPSLQHQPVGGRQGRGQGGY